MKLSRHFIMLLIALFALFIDQWSKLLILKNWKLYETLPIIENLHFTYVQNTGSLFGLFQGNALVLGIVSFIISIGVLIYGLKLSQDQSIFLFIALGLLLGGALGNMLDRFYLGYVVDFFDIRFQGKNVWPVFNIADIAINIAIGIYLLIGLFDVYKDFKNENAKNNEVQSS